MAKDVRHKNIETGKWQHVTKGNLVADGTYVDISGVLRSSVDDSCVVWHYKNCQKTGIESSEIIHDEKTNAPWCPSCWNKKRLKEHFGK